ncbi:MAG: branched-chain amino acid ABC transporter permease [Burkholderiales bacterium]|nr:branched-chain amino acid ABC transporter permease [Burkholderiales bacterium]
MSAWRVPVALLAVALAYPLVFRTNFAINFGVLVLFFAVIGQAWNIAGGFAGQLSFGHAVFFGTGAYCSTILHVKLGINPWLGLWASAAAGALVGAFIAALSFRFGLKGSYFALITLAFAEAFRILTNAVEFTGGGLGLLIPLKRSAANFQFPERIGFYYTILALAALSIAIALWLKRSRFGARLAAIRENEDAARALGIDTFREKVKIMALSGALCAAGGTFYAQYFLYIDPVVVFGADKSVEMLLVSMIGGTGTVYGPLIGAFLLTLVGEGTRALTNAQGLSLIIYGGLLIVIIAFLPNGLIDLFKLRWGRRRA